MLLRCESDSMVERAIQFIKRHRAEKTSPYIYLNLVKYGASNDDVLSWILVNDKESMVAIYVLYYDCLHAFVPSVDEKSFSILLDLVTDYVPRTVMVSGVPEEVEIPGFGAEWLTDHNYIIDMDNVGVFPRDYKSVLAVDADIEAIADLMIADSHYSDIYDRSILVRQMRERLCDGFSRFVIIRDEDRVAAACSTYGESDDLAMVGGVIVGPEYRRRGFASDIEEHICKTLEDCKKSRIALVSVTNTQSLALHEKLGAVRIGMIHKFVLLA